MRWYVLVFVVFALLLGQNVALAQDDDLPLLCDNLFARYESWSGRLVMVSWASGEDVLELASGLPQTVITGWSLDCRYLSAAVGTFDSMDTVVWDAVTGARLGAVPDAHAQPHHTTWGPGDFLVVETRDGAVLWNAPANVQMPLDVSFDPVSVRNFSRLRWDAENGQLLVNLALGDRMVFDLATGAALPVAANVTDSVAGDGHAGIVIGGKEYQCQDGYRYGYRNWFSSAGTQIAGIDAVYDIANRRIILQLSPYGRNSQGEALQLVESDVDASWFQFRGWSVDCRYFAASLGVPGSNSSDTVVWDVVAQRRMGAFEDAREIPHGVKWGLDSLVVQTRDGAYLWNLSTDTRVLINANVETALAGSPNMNNFHSLQWIDGLWYGVPIGGGHTVVVYDASTGAQVNVYGSGGTAAPVGFALSPDGGYIIVYESETNAAMLWDRATGRSHPLQRTGYWHTIAFSPDNHYLATYRYPSIRVWDLTDLQPDGAPNRVFENVSGMYSAEFIDGVTLESSSGARLNVVTGEYVAIAPPAPVATTPIATQSGKSIGAEAGTGGRGNRDRMILGVACADRSVRYDEAGRTLYLRPAEDAPELVLTTNVSLPESLYWSPGCDMVYARIPVVSDADLGYDDRGFDDMPRDLETETLFFWDGGSGALLSTFNDPHTYYSHEGVYWSPGGDWALVRTNDGFFIWQPATGHRVMADVVPYTWYYGIEKLYDIYWDFQRSQLITSSSQGAQVIDLFTGEQRYFLSINTATWVCYWGAIFTVSDDNTTLTVSCIGAGVNYDQGVWNLDTLEHRYERYEWKQLVEVTTE